MQQATASHDQDDGYCAVVSDLVSLIEHVQKSLRLIEQTIAGGKLHPATPRVPPPSSCSTTYPRYMKATAALQACDE
ncbi:hypothetical protein [Bradyrhizobium valentinum]|uniref:Uncharacterized protein n=1 Tax=Bradyrhizobium valentinum TaxID=1518501 RepID=A0A0R3M313_9BRAD|nr:hypothetical protein [Bradyrhizobium valentinum]KRQ95828.1 hypothetical protein CQ10_31900 [Bradyrhizobium valentinum]KRR14473.1 hypothetical protein CP49_41670 [Bradyrhizobium valentinum]